MTDECIPENAYWRMLALSHVRVPGKSGCRTVVALLHVRRAKLGQGGLDDMT